MRKKLAAEIAELRQVHNGLTEVASTGNETVLKGLLHFEASADGYGSITDCFGIELIIPETYPKRLPRVRETGDKIDSDYDHVYQDGTLCLAVPIEERRVFMEQPSLLGFVNKLVIPYLFGYCHWKTHATHPFDESKHGSEGIIRHYMDVLGLADEIAALAIVSFLYEYGYRGHHSCPCGSREKVRKCHGKALRDLHEQHTDLTLKNDFLSVLDVCISKIKSEEIEIPKHQSRQVLRLLDRMEQ